MNCHEMSLCLLTSSDKSDLNIVAVNTSPVGKDSSGRDRPAVDLKEFGTNCFLLFFQVVLLLLIDLSLISL